MSTRPFLFLAATPLWEEDVSIRETPPAIFAKFVLRDVLSFPRALIFLILKVVGREYRVRNRKLFLFQNVSGAIIIIIIKF